MKLGDESPDVHEAEHVTAFDPESGARASEAVLTAVAAVADTDPGELDPLYDVVDPEALDSLFDDARTADERCELWVRYEGLEVCVRNDGTIRIWDPSSTTDPNTS